jgi:GAF domain-containing protein
MGCLRISFDRGVCGAAARTRKTQLVPDVHAFPGHIACDSRSRSEVVVPIVRRGELLGVLDLDSPHVEGFSQAEADALEALMKRAFQAGDT